MRALSLHLRRQSYIHGRARGFTLLEVLAVMGIILVLAGFTVGLATSAHSRAAEGRVKMDMAVLSQALEDYRMKAGDYPWVAAHPTMDKKPNPEGVSALIKALLGLRPLDPERPHLQAEAILFHSDQLDFTHSGYDQPPFKETDSPWPADSWGNPYLYLYNASFPQSEGRWELPGYLLLSAGPDGKATFSEETLTTGIINWDDFYAHPVNRDNIFRDP